MPSPCPPGPGTALAPQQDPCQSPARPALARYLLHSIFCATARPLRLARQMLGKKPRGSPCRTPKSYKSINCRLKKSRQGVSWLCRGFELALQWTVVKRYAFDRMKFLAEPRSGSAAGTTSSRNRYGQYTRTRAIPVNPNSAAQGAARGRLSANAAFWRTLTANQRAGWEDLASQMVRSDALGSSYTLNGFGAFVSVNNNNLQAAVARVSDAPALVSPAGIDTATVTLTSAAFSIAFTPTPLATGYKLLVYASPQRNAGRSYESDYRLIFVGSAATTSPANVLSAYTAKYGVPVTGNQVFLSLHAFVSGFRSGPLRVNQVVA